jgi:hypothetical protein
VLVEEFQEPWEDIYVVGLTHKDVLVSVVWENLQLVPARHQLFKLLVAIDVGVSEDAIALARHEEHRCLDIERVLEVIVWQLTVLRIVRVVLTAPPALTILRTCR